MVLDYSVNVERLEDSDLVLDYGELGNFSVAGFKMTLHRHVSHYLITYYLPSGELASLYTSRNVKTGNSEKMNKPTIQFKKICGSYFFQKTPEIALYSMFKINVNLCSN